MLDNLNSFEMFFVWLISKIESIYMIYTGILIVWGLLIVYLLVNIIKKIEKHRKNSNEPKISFLLRSDIRFCDKIHLLTILTITFINFVSFLITPIAFSSFMDLLIVSNFWITGYFVFVMCTSLKHWPNIIFKNEFRIN